MFMQSHHPVKRKISFISRCKWCQVVPKKEQKKKRKRAGRTVPFLGNNLNSFTSSNVQLIVTIAAKVVQHLGSGLLGGGRRCRGGRRRRSSGGAGRRVARVRRRGGHGRHGLRHNSRLSGGLARLGHGLCRRGRLPGGSGELRRPAARAAWSKQFALCDGSRGNLLCSRSRFGYGAWRLSGTSVDSAALVAVNSTRRWVLDSLDVSQLPGLFVVLDAIGNVRFMVSANTLGRWSYLSPILRFKDPRRALERWVKNSVLNTQFRRGSGS